MSKRILVVDDEQAIADLVALYLENEGFIVDTFYHSPDALKATSTVGYDLAIIDVMMPDLDGFAFLSELRKSHHFPVIMLTSRDGDMDKINGLTLGADDYMTKPFQPLELVARVKAQLRRTSVYSQQNKQEQVLSIRGLVLSLSTREVMLNEQAVELTPKEYDILKYLMQHVGQVVDVDKLYQSIWKEKYYTNANNTVMVHVRHLREKLCDTSEKPTYIKTVWGVGYTIEQ